MYKKYTVLIFSLLWFSAISQNTFVTSFDNFNNSYGNCFTEHAGSYYYGVNNPVNIDTTHSFLFRIDAFGYLTDSIKVGSQFPETMILSCCYCSDTIYYLYSRSLNDSLDLYFGKTTTDFSYQYENSLKFRFKGVVYFAKVFSFSDSLLDFGICYQPLPILDFQSFLLKIGKTGTIDKVKQLVNSPCVRLSDYFFSKEDSFYYAAMAISNHNGVQDSIFKLDTEFNTMSGFQVSDSINYGTNVLKQSDGTLILSGRYYILDWTTGDVEKEMCFIRLDTLGYIDKFASIGSPDTVDIPASFTHTAFSCDSSKVFFVYTKNLRQYSTYAEIPTWIAVGAFDNDLNLLWLHFYGDELNYIVYDMMATSDGGALINATQYDWNTQTNERDALLLKLNSDGLLTSTPENPALLPHHAIVYPNPGHGALKVEAGPQIFGATFELFDVSGQRVAEQPIQTSVTAINTAALASGVYPWRIIWKGEVVEEGKWVKE